MSLEGKFNKRTRPRPDPAAGEAGGGGTNITDKFNYSKGSRSNRYALQFHKESYAEIKARKELACQTLKSVAETELEVINYDDLFPKELDFPKRPTWSYNYSKEALEARETQYFTDYVNEMQTKVDWKEMGFFELNLETWRQLWRVLEMSDIILLIVDIRFPVSWFLSK